MMKRLLTVLLVGAALLAVVPVSAHHSFSAAYFESEIQRIEGDIAVVLFRNPHSWIHVDVKENGQVVRYSIEWGSGAQLTQQGVTRNSLKVGDHVVVVGNPGRKASEHRLRMRQIERPADGWKWGGTFD
jgi:hypothetical protein